MAKNTYDAYEQKGNVKYDFDKTAIADIPKRKRPENIHKDHRKRVRERFLNDGGIEKFADHNVLEFLLFYAVPVKDTNELAHNLLYKFGSIPGVFDASIKDLCTVDGVGENTAILIKLIPQLFRRYEVDKLKKSDVPLSSAENVARYAAKHFIGVKEERLYLMCLDNMCNLLSFTKITEGTVNKTSIDMRLITKIAFETNASSLILVHNHPSGIVAPSKADVDATLDVVNITKAVGLKLSDHIIIGECDEYFSFRKSEKWKSLFK